MTTIGESISRVRNQIKSVKQDAFLTDRFLYSVIMKHAKLLMRRQDNMNKIMKFSSVFQPLKFVELIDVDKADAGCICIYTGCKIKRSKEKLPTMFEGYFGPLIRTVSSLDMTEDLTPTYPSIFEKMVNQKTFRYNKKKYYWYLDGYLYFPNIEWDAVRVEGVFEGDISKFNCEVEDDCAYIQDKSINIPEFLFSEIEQLVARDMGLMMQIPNDSNHDMGSLTR